MDLFDWSTPHFRTTYFEGVYDQPGEGVKRSAVGDDAGELVDASSEAIRFGSDGDSADTVICASPSAEGSDVFNIRVAGRRIGAVAATRGRF